MDFRRAFIVVLCVTISLTGCHTMRPVNLTGEQPLVSKVAPGDYVRIWMRDGSRLELQIAAIEPDALVSREQRIPIKDIERLERRGISVTRTTLLVLGIGALVFVSAVAIACASSPCMAP